MRKDVFDAQLVNESILYNVDHLEKALIRKTQVSFLYFDLNENHERVYRKEKQKYVVDPVALVFMEDNYYLMCYSDAHEKVVNYRVDRMKEVTVLDTPVCDAAQIPEKQIAAYTGQTFKMFGGEPETISLKSMLHCSNMDYRPLENELLNAKATMTRRGTWNGKKLLIVNTMGLFSGDGTGCTARLLKKYGASILGGMQIKMPDSVCDSKLLKKDVEENRQIVRSADNRIEQAAEQMRQGNYPQEGLSVIDPKKTLDITRKML